MQLIPKTAVRSWAVHSGGRGPHAISTVCPHCREKVIFTLGQTADDQVRRSQAGSAFCPACSQPVHFWTMRADAKLTSETEPDAIFMYPTLKGHFQVRELSAEVPEALKRSFASTVDSFNSKNFVATSVGCRRTLEGMIQYLLPEAERKGTLMKLIEKAVSATDFAAPLKSLSHAIREGGNLGAHFDSEKEPTEEMARQMVELLDYLIAYLYVLPPQIAKLEKGLGKEV